MSVLRFRRKPSDLDYVQNSFEIQMAKKTYEKLDDQM